MTPLERLMQEAIPTRPDPAPKPARQAELPGWWTPAEQARHRQELDEALDGWHWDDDYAEARRDRQRERVAHLRVVDDETGAA